MNRWFLVYCKPNQEIRAEQNLKRQGYEVFLPKIQNANKHVGKGKNGRVECLFSRYLFIQVDPDKKSIAPVSSTLGVVNIVKFGNRYAMATAELINEIQTYAQRQLASTPNSDMLQTGDEVTVNGHGFQQIKGIFTIPCGNSRAMILLNILGNESRIKVPLACITKDDTVVA